MNFTTRPELKGTFGAVATTHWLASACGMRALEAGGNAFDAAVCAGFVLQVVEPHLNGPGGDMPLLGCPAGADEPFVLCAQGPAPRRATIAAFAALGLDMIPATGHLAACVPGTVGGWLTLLRDHGTMRLRDLLEPAIHYAERGYPLVPQICDTIASVRDLFVAEWTSSAAIYLKDGVVPAAGTLFRNPALAATYRAMLAAAEGASGREAQVERALAHWYQGPVAAAIDRFGRETAAWDVSGERHYGLLTADDMAAWRPGYERPAALDRGRHRIFKTGPWGQGPLLLLALRYLEGTDLAGMAPDGPDFVHAVTEALKLAMLDRDAWFGDSGEVPLPALLADPFAAARRARLGPRASFDLEAGGLAGEPAPAPPWRLGSAAGRGAGAGEPTTGNISARPAPPTLDRRGEPALERTGATRGDTCHLDVIDRHGNMVSATPSGGWLQSNPVIPELGFPLGSRAQMFWLVEGLNSSLVPGRRPRTTLSPSLAFRDGKPWLAFGTPGGDQQDQWQLQFFLHLADHGMNLQEAIDTPAFHTDHAPASFWPRQPRPGSLTVEGRFPAATVAELERRGHLVNVGGPWSEGRLSACAREDTPEGTMVKAAANPRGMQGYAIAR